MKLNIESARIAEEMVERAEELNLGYRKLENGAAVIDAGIDAKGGFEAGRLFAMACMGGLAEVEFFLKDYGRITMPSVVVSTSKPAVACLSSQKAGWQIKTHNFFALGSGPARILARKPKSTIEKVGYEERSEVGVIALETGVMPDEEVADLIAKACGIAPARLYIIVARTASIANLVQIAARSVESALFKLDYLGYDASKVEHGIGIAPVPPILGNDEKMMGISNDAIIYGSTVFLYLGEDVDAEKVPSSSSESYGRPFLDIFKEAGGDFYKLDPGIFGPAEVYLNDTKSYTLKKAGKVNSDVLKGSLGGGL